MEWLQELAGLYSLDARYTVTNRAELPHVGDVVSYLVNAQFQDSITVVGTAHNVHNCLLVPCLLSSDAPIFAYYPPLQEISRDRPLTLAPQVQTYIEQLPSSPVLPISDKDVLFWALARLIKAYEKALNQRTDRMTQEEARIDAPFPPMTTAEYQERTAYVVERAITISLEQTVDWWADVTCGVALTSPSDAALAALALTRPDSRAEYRQLNSWRQIGYIIESLER